MTHEHLKGWGSTAKAGIIDGKLVVANKLECISCGEFSDLDEMHGRLCEGCHFDPTSREHLYDERIDQELINDR